MFLSFTELLRREMCADRYYQQMREQTLQSRIDALTKMLGFSVAPIPSFVLVVMLGQFA